MMLLCLRKLVEVAWGCANRLSLIDCSGDGSVRTLVEAVCV